MKTTLLGIPITLKRTDPLPGETVTHDYGVRLEVGGLTLGVRVATAIIPRPGKVALRTAHLRLRVDNFALTLRAPAGETFSRIARTTPEAIEDGVEPVIFRFPPDGAVVLANPDDFCPEMYLPDYLPNLATLRQGFGVRAERV